MTKKLLIVYHSQSGTTAQLAAAVVKGAGKEQAVAVDCLRAWDASVAELMACDGLLLGLAENSASAAGSIKDFLDRIYYSGQAAAAHKPYALFVSAGNDGRGAVAQVERILRGIPMKPVAKPVICRGEAGAAGLQHCEVLGHTLAAGLACGIF